MKKISGLLGAGSLAAALLIMAFGAGTPARAASQAPGVKSGVAQQAQAQVPTITGSIKVPKPEPRDLSSLAKIRADQAMAAAQAAFPGAAVKKVELDNENGYLVYSLELSNGGEVLVDAGNGLVLRREPPSAEHNRHEAEEKAK